MSRLPLSARQLASEPLTVGSQPRGPGRRDRRLRVQLARGNGHRYRLDGDICSSTLTGPEEKLELLGLSRTGAAHAVGVCRSTAMHWASYWKTRKAERGTMRTTALKPSACLLNVPTAFHPGADSGRSLRIDLGAEARRGQRGGVGEFEVQLSADDALGRQPQVRSRIRRRDRAVVPAAEGVTQNESHRRHLSACSYLSDFLICRCSCGLTCAADRTARPAAPRLCSRR